MTSPEPTPDLRTLAAEAILRIDMSADLDDLDDDEQVEYFDQADAVLSAVLPAHRAIVAEEIAQHFDAAALVHGHPNPSMCHYTEIAAEVRRLAATTPPARQDSPGTTGQARVVPEPGPEPVYRVGRKVGRTIYRHDVLIGVMDTPELAALAVEAMNRAEEDTDAA